LANADALLSLCTPIGYCRALLLIAEVDWGDVVEVLGFPWL
jgi:hypothetical protein